jgi:hypothetical protein
VAGLVIGLVFLFWYPAPYGDISGGSKLLLILIAVDLVIGPVLTFAVFDRRKPSSELRRDLALIVAMQLAALAYGMFTVAEARPVVLALEGDRLRVVRAIDLSDADLARAPVGLKVLRWTGPEFVATRPPKPSEKLEAIDRALAGQDIGMRPEFWHPLSHTGAAYIQAVKPLQKLRKLYPERAGVLEAAIAATGLPIERLGYLPILGRSTDWSALVDVKDGRIVGYVHLDGF